MTTTNKSIPASAVTVSASVKKWAIWIIVEIAIVFALSYLVSRVLGEPSKKAAVSAQASIPLASAPLSSWSKLAIPANGKSGRISVPPEMHVITTDEVGSRLHNVYKDGSECVEACTDGPLAGVYITNDSRKEITISYSFAHK